MVALAAEMALGAHPALVVLTTAATTTVGTIYSPAAAALTPQLVPEKALGAANALRNAIDNLCVIAGPALGALVLLVASESVTVLVNAATYAVSAVLTARISVRSTPVDVTEGGEVGPLKQMLVGLSTIAQSSSVATLVGFSVVATFVFGTDTVLFVVLSDQVLGTGSEGYGYLLTGLGVGGVLAAGVVTRLERLPRLGTVILVGMAGYCLPTLLFLTFDQPAVAFVAQVVRGASTLVVDVLAITALQTVHPVGPSRPGLRRLRRPVPARDRGGVSTGPAGARRGGTRRGPVGHRPRHPGACASWRCRGCSAWTARPSPGVTRSVPAPSFSVAAASSARSPRARWSSWPATRSRWTPPPARWSSVRVRPQTLCT